MMRILSFALAWFCCLPAIAADTPVPPPAQAPIESWLDYTLTPYGPMLIQQGPPPPYRDYQMSRVLTPEEKQNWLQMAMPMVGNLMQVDAREAMNHFAVKYRAKPGLRFDDVVQSMMLRANQVNLKFVGTNAMWKDFQAVLGDKDAPRIEILSFCDIAIGRELLKILPEMVVFFPCRIAVMEDADKAIWVLMLDWDITWLNLAGKQLGMTPELRSGFLSIREKMDSVMRAGANGEL
ncbi:MAG: DUF302 domain-containing protein [Thiobacillus sp.]